MDTTVLELSFWPIVFLLASGQAFFLSFLFFHSRSKRPSNFFLAIFFVLFGYMLVFNFCFWTNNHLRYPHILYTLPVLNYLFGPLLFLYFKKRTGPGKIHFTDGLHFIPAILLIVHLVPFFIMSASEKLDAVSGSGEFPSLTFGSFLNPMLHYQIFGISLMFYLLWKLRIVIVESKRNMVASEASSNISMKWIWTLWGLYAIWVLSYLSYFYLSQFSFFNLTHDYIISGVMTLSIYTLGFMAYKEPGVLFTDSLKKVWGRTQKYESSSLTSGASKSIAALLEKHMSEEKPYLNSNLKIRDVSQDLDISSHHLSQVINEQFNQSFNRFVNEYRIKEARRFLEDSDYAHLLIKQIGYKVGFNNKTTFHETFKSVTGRAPSDYRSTHSTDVRTKH